MISLSEVLRTGPGKQFLHLSVKLSPPYLWAGQLALPDQGLERGMEQVDHSPILGQQSHSTLAHVDDRPASSIPKKRRANRYMHGSQLISRCPLCCLSDHCVGTGRLCIAEDTHTFWLSQGGSANIHVELLAGNQCIDLVTVASWADRSNSSSAMPGRLPRVSGASGRSPGRRRTIGPQIVLQEKHIALKNPVDFCR